MRRKKLVAPVQIRNEKTETNNDKLIEAAMYEWMAFAKTCHEPVDTQKR